MGRTAAIAVVLAAVLAGCSSTTDGTPVGSSTSAPPVVSSSEAPPGPPLPEVAPIPAKRVPLPRRPKPLASPTNCAYPKSGEAPAREVTPPKQSRVPTKGQVEVTLRTSAGEIGLTLDRALAPCTVHSMVSLIQQGFYQGSECHRLGVEPTLQMLQCGDPTGTGTGGPGYTVPDEQFPQLSYGRGILALAKTSQPDSGGSQFFMVYGNADIPAEYAVFGSIDDAGLKVLDKVARGGVDPAGVQPDGSGKPKIPVQLTQVIAHGD